MRSKPEVFITLFSIVLLFTAGAGLAQAPGTIVPAIRPNIERDLPTLNGAEAIDHLRNSGKYDSLVEAVNNAVMRDGKTEVRSPSDAFTLRKKVTASNPSMFAMFGGSVAISGSTAIVGATNETFNGNSFQGAAYIFVRSGNTWNLQQRLTAPEGMERDRFGYSVGIDGERAIVGVPEDDIGASSNQGSAYVFLRSGTVWSLESILTGADSGAGDQFGTSVAIDGVTAVVGSYNGDGSAIGGVYVFVKGNIWTQQQKLTPTDGGASDHFGISRNVAISGEAIIVGSRFAGQQSTGAAYLFTRSGSTWTQHQKLVAPDEQPFAEFGFSVGISGDNVIVGAWKDPVGGGGQQGSAYIFYRSGVFWTFQQKLTASDGQAGDRFGMSVGIHGSTAVVGAGRIDTGPQLPGAAYVFAESGSTWSEQHKLTGPPVNYHDRFGSSVAINGQMMIIGSDLDSLSQSYQGSAYVFGSGTGTIVAPPEKIAFSSGRDGNDEIYVMNPDGSGQTRLTDQPGSTDLHPSFSGDTSLITFSSTRDGNAEIYVMNGNDGSNQTRLTNNSANDTQPSLSRDGLYITFTSDREGNDEIYIMRTNGTHLTRLTSNSLSDTAPSFSPSGSRILFERVGQDGNRDIYIMNADGTGQTRLTTAAGDDFSPTFSRDGTRIAFASVRDGNKEIYVMNPDGSGQTRLTNNAFNDTEPSFSPDGARIVFESDRNGDPEIYVMKSDGTQQTWLTNVAGADAAPDWGGVAASQSNTGQLTVSGAAALDNFGICVALSGETAVVGANGVDFPPNFGQGAAYVFVRTGGAWILEQRLTASDGADSDDFGRSIAISGGTVVVGAPRDDVGSAMEQGSAYVFVRSGQSWIEQQKLTASDGAQGDAFGSSVAIDGATAIIGAESKRIGTEAAQGAAYAFVRSGTTWAQQYQFIAADGNQNDRFGKSVAISGETAVIGAMQADGTLANQGAAYAYVRSGTAWTQQQKLTASDPAGFAQFGYSVDISGETAIIGSRLARVGANANQGAAYVFVRTGTTWYEQQKLTAPDGVPNDFFGESVTISGEIAVAGAPEADVAAADQGAAYTFVRSGTTWTHLQKTTAPNAGTSDRFGQSMASSGETAIAGASFYDIGANNAQGSAFIFSTVPPPPPTPTPSPTPMPTLEPNTPVGTNVTVQLHDVSVTFSTVTQAGQTSFAAIDPPGSAGTPPAGLAICPTCPAYDITTTAIYSPPVNVCLGVPFLISDETFSVLKLLHGEGGVLIDRTSGRFTHTDGRRSVCGTVSSLSPFVLAAPLPPTPTPTPANGTLFDYDGDEKADLSVFRPSDRVWYINQSTAGFRAVEWGLASDSVVPADYDGDRKTDIATWRADFHSSGYSYFFVNNSADNTIRKEQFGRPGDQPLPVGDWDGDGKADLAVYRNGTNGESGRFYYRPSSQPEVDFVTIVWGVSGDIPIRGDFDGDGRSDAAVFRQSDHTWYILQSSDGEVRYERWGLVSDKLVPADYDGDGKTDLAVFRNGIWYISRSSDGQAVYIHFGLNTDYLVPADYDGDGKTDVGVFRNGTWYILWSSSSGVSIEQFGLPDDRPVPSAYVLTIL